MSKIVDKSDSGMLKGRFAPSPTGRMHLGNIYAALMSWLSVKSRGGSLLLRIEDLDPQRSRSEYAKLIEDDLLWLGLCWDEGGLDGIGSASPYLQSRRSDIYENVIERLSAQSLLYPCRCTRADILSAQAPHQSDGRIVYMGKCRPAQLHPLTDDEKHSGALRMVVENRIIEFTDNICGRQRVNLAEHCGDFIVRRADGTCAYQLAVVVDDAMMGVTEVMRGEDLLLSTAQQIYIYEKLGFRPPQFAHIPLICNEQGQRLSKRDRSLSMEELRKQNTPEELLGRIAKLAGLRRDASPVTLHNLIEIYRNTVLRQKNSTEETGLVI
ncbi:MAG: tRNA glutamyl-Q(34) synthetase GluQRS [Muribaculaceae bacterium]|nr:tRNA glutamyl-Q(34) synthetase GluQRS [Muribaculaceae bacterium]